LLRAEGWKVLVVWECWTRHPESLAKKLRAFLESGLKETDQPQRIRRGSLHSPVSR
jgi:G:T-mismatch repair DNA endonuclease (very short patch repair protein)